jgi:hypothetical protein
VCFCGVVCGCVSVRVARQALRPAAGGGTTRDQRYFLPLATFLFLYNANLPNACHTLF